MTDAERPSFIKPEEESALMGYPAPGNKAQRARLEEESERDKGIEVRSLVAAGKLKLTDVHDMLVGEIRKREERHQDPAGLRKR